MNSRLKIIVSGLVAQYPLGGVSWDYLQYVLGLSKMGHDVYYLEDTGFWPYNPATGGLSEDGCSYNVTYLKSVMEQFDLQDKWMYRHDYTDQWYGLSESQRRTTIASADLLINVSGCLAYPERYRSIKHMAFIDSDPVFTQIKLLLGYQSFRDQIDHHDVLFSFAENPSHKIPSTGDQWLPTRQPIVLDEWQPVKAYRETFTTVMNWTSYDSLEHDGEKYGQKDAEFTPYIDLPASLPKGTLELAVNDGKTTKTPKEQLQSAGWGLVSPETVCADMNSYRDYIRYSRAEWSVAKQGYVKGQSGWFSCRSACYLAAARPVIVQDTGFSNVITTGDGLIAFNNFEQALAGIESIRSHPDQHINAARAVAETYFDSGTVLTSLIDRALNKVPEDQAA